MDNNHYAMESLYGAVDGSGRISKVSVQWLLVNRWLPMWISNTEMGPDYKVIDFLADEDEAYGIASAEGASNQPEAPDSS